MDRLSHLDISPEARKSAAERDEALPDGSYPIRNREDLKRAVQAFGRAKDKEKVKKWIIKRAKELDAVDMLPEDWAVEEKVLEHYGVKGMKWGVRKSSSTSSNPSPVSYKAKPGEKIETSGGHKQPTSEDAIKAAVYKQKAKSSGIQSLSNAEMQAVVTRMNLENQYKNLNPKELTKGQKYVQTFFQSPAPDAAIAITKTLTKDNPDFRVQAGLQIAEAIARAAKPKKKKK